MVIQNSNCIACDRGLSDFNTKSRFVVNGLYDLPFHGNRLKDGWQISLFEQTQTGQPAELPHLDQRDSRVTRICGRT